MAGKWRYAYRAVDEHGQVIDLFVSPRRNIDAARPMRGLKTDRTAAVVIRGYAFIQNLRRNHYQLGADTRHQHLRVAAAFDELTVTI